MLYSCEVYVAAQDLLLPQFNIRENRTFNEDLLFTAPTKKLFFKKVKKKQINQSSPNREYLDHMPEFKTFGV